MNTLGLKRGIVKLVPYNKKWKEEFQKEERRLELFLKNKIEAIEHIGSTAIKNIPAKPIIDIVIGIASMKDSKKFIKFFKKADYEWRSKVGGSHIRLFFAKGPESKRTHYIHLLKHNGTIWKNQLAFRDYLNINKKATSKYSKLKQNLEKQYKGKRKYYTAAKAKFIHGIFKKAR